MRTTYRRLTQTTIAMGALLLTTLAIAAPITRTTNRGLTIRKVSIQGNAVTMTVVNRTGRTLTASISSRLLMRSGEIPLTIPVTAAAGQTVTITVVPPELGRSDLPLGVVVDDGVPF